MPGFLVAMEFNDSYAFRDYPRLTKYQRIHQELIPDMSGAPRGGHRRCKNCGELLAKWEEPLSGLIIKKRTYDISGTCDGVCVVSHKFKAVCRERGLSGLLFCPLPEDPDFFHIQATRIVAFDAERRNTRFLKKCAECGRYASVVGATPVFLKPGAAIGEREFVRSDLEFASADEKSPLILCGLLAGEALRDAGLRGLHLIPF